MTDRVLPLNPESLPKHFEAGMAEKKWDEFWEKEKIHAYDPSKNRDETFVVDTPPPTVSGSLHIGHVFSYTHTDIITRQQRMMGKNIFYPMGWDDNGLPTERRVQNMFHVRCDPNLPYDPHLEIKDPSDQERKERPKIISRRNFIELCSRVTKEDEKIFMSLFRRVGLSVDWTYEYATIDDSCRRLAQFSFLDLWQKNQVKQVEAPTMWDVDFQTAVAQAEVEDRNLPGAFHQIEFAVEGGGKFTIATTRPELLAACVGVTAHPSDERYKIFFGKKAITPLFQVPVPIFSSELADPEKGTGILMVCTFGDQTDVQWWREQKLNTRQIIGRDGRMLAVEFGKDPFQSLDSTKAQENYSKIVGKTVKQAQVQIVELLKAENSSVTGGSKALVKDPEPIQHAVKFFEKGDRPLEFMTTRQWFVQLLNHKQALLDQGEKISWHPDFMKTRFRNWTENLGIDWCISRQRYFGVPIPAWYRVNEKGEVDYSQTLLPKKDELPIDPMSHVPAGFTEGQRGQPNGFVGEPDVFDTWFTSSLTPQIGSQWAFDNDRHKKLFPADLRPQSHEIIRTWAFYTIAKAYLHEAEIPWKNIAISGWILDPDRKKMSKSKGNVITPMHLLDEYSADGVRYWASSARLGMDTAFDEQVLKVGRRLTTKLYNAAKFVLAQEGPKGAPSEELDLAFLSQLKSLVERSSQSFEQFNFAQALQDTEKFFWTQFTDTYLELVKQRAKNENSSFSPQAQASAIASLRIGLGTLLRLFAPFLPYITEEIWSWQFASEMNSKSIHKAPWPSKLEFSKLQSPEEVQSFASAIQALSTIHKYKTENGMTVGTPLPKVNLKTNAEEVARLKRSLADLKAAARVDEIYLEVSNDEEAASILVSS